MATIAAAPRLVAPRSTSRARAPTSGQAAPDYFVLAMIATDDVIAGRAILAGPM
ncbi:MAG: hypothetical protein JNN10_03695 [Sphingopyxis sp.]|uniref:hypothetical protein n=1 Tax=Sphingopyxis sp. TaxID=1908224 RepID=UPI001A367634|nr:hypothetical protein [Sphingopyxis sp.]MBL9065379.1 hypothetical protein [Sphingopyxis sp.]